MEESVRHASKKTGGSTRNRYEISFKGSISRNNQLLESPNLIMEESVRYASKKTGGSTRNR
jgi:hypothetical protein